MILASPALIVFDLDDTLLDHRAAEAAALADVHRMHAEHVGHHPFDHVHASYRDANVPLWRDFGRGLITGEQLRQLRSERLLAALGCDMLSPETLDRDYLARYAAHWRWASGARAAYHAVADAVPVGILTNGFSAQQRGKLAALPEIAERAAFVVISEEVGVMKPDPGIFDHVRRQAGETLGRDVAASDLLYVGYSYHSDVLGGTGAGWPVAWYNGDAERAPAGAFAFDDWPALLARLGL